MYYICRIYIRSNGIYDPTTFCRRANLNKDNNNASGIARVGRHMINKRVSLFELDNADNIITGSNSSAYELGR